MSTRSTRYQRVILPLTLLSFIALAHIPDLSIVGAGGGNNPSVKGFVSEPVVVPRRDEHLPDASFTGRNGATKSDLEKIRPWLAATACGFVSPPIDPSPMDCFTNLVANHDDSPLGVRTPVILIHGIHGNGPDPQNTTNDGYFANLIAHLNSNASFRERYKIYRFHYRSDFQPVKEIARSLRNRIDDLVKQNPALEPRKFVLIAHSMGGLVARSYMNEHDTDFGPTFQGRRAGERISRLMALATPHHGSVGASGLARSFGNPLWGPAFDALDFIYWTIQNDCALCGVDPSHPNRSDLRFDNFNGLWNNNSNYQNLPFEKNDWLRSMPKTFDALISAYFGYIGGNEAVAAVGSLGPLALEEYVRTSQGDNFKVQLASGVLQRKIELADFGSAIEFLNNDGLVSTDSGMYKQGSVGRQIQCGGYNHEDMKDGRGGDCTLIGTGIRKREFAFVLDELLSLQPISSDSQSPSVTITSPTSDSTFSTSNGSINLAGSASDNVGVTRVTWTNSRGGSGTASGTTSWTATGVVLQTGTNTLTIRPQDGAGNIGSDILTVIFTPSVNDTSSASVKITSPTSGSNYSTTGSTMTLRGTATDNVGVTQVTWSNNRGGTGTASGTVNWTANVTGLLSGANVLTVRARDAANNSGTATLTVTFTSPPVCGNGMSENYRVNGGPPLHPNGSLVKLRTDPTVFLIQNGQRRGIPSQAILNALYQQPNGGFQDKDVITIAADELSRYPLGAVVNSSLPSNGMTQPDGRLIQRVGGSEISVVSGGTRRPFASESTFVGLGFLYCNVVAASDYDSYPVGIIVDAITTLNISVIPTAQATRDWGGSVIYTFTVRDGNGTPVSGAAVGGQDNLRGIGVFLATASTDSSGQGTYTTTVPNGTMNAVYDIMFMTDKAGYTGSDLVTRQVQVSHFQDTEPPSVSITSPTTNSSFSTSLSPISLSGFASDNVGVTQVAWANDRMGAGTATGTSNWSVAAIPLQEGANVLTITARDSAGNIGTANLIVTYTPMPSDGVPPTIEITSPAGNNHETSISPITVNGTASDNIGVSQVTWINDRGGSGSANGTTNWSASSIGLHPGFNVLTVIARDASGNIGTTTLIVNFTTASVDTAGPALVINSPSDGQTFSTSSITVSGTATDAGLGASGIFSITVNGARADGDTVSEAGTASWSRTIALVQGANIITVTARDNSSNQNSTTRSITVNLQAGMPSPSLIGMSPDRVTAGGPGFVLTVNGANFTQTSTVRWNGSDRVTRFINGRQLQADILADDISVTGRFVFVSVFNPPASGSINTLRLEWINDQASQITIIDLPLDILPNRFPADFPRELPGDLITQNYNAFSNDSRYQATREFTTSRSVDENFGFYRDYLLSHGWSIAATVEQPNFKAITAFKDGFPAHSGVAASINSQVNSITGVKTVSISFSSFTDCLAAPDGLIGQWSAENNASDTLGLNGGALRNGASTDVNGPAGFGHAFHLDGVDDYVEIPDSPTLRPSTVTIEAWVQLKSLESYSAIPGLQAIVFKRNSRSQQIEGLSLQKIRTGGKDVFELVATSVEGIQARATGTHSVSSGQFYHVVATFDGAALKLYVNGVLESQISHGHTLDYGSRPWLFGSFGGAETLDDNASGIIDEVTLYNRALSGNEIRALYDAGGNGKCAPTSALPTIQFHSSSFAGSERAGVAEITVSRTGNLAEASAVRFETSSQSASDRSDFTAAMRSIRFAAGETSKTISVYITDDALAESPETFRVALSSPSGGLLGPSISADVTISDNDVTTGPSPVGWGTSFNTQFYVRQQYLDFLLRDADPAGFQFWQNEINQCGGNEECLEVKRINVSAAFFLSIEFQETGYLVYRAYKAAYGNIAPDKPVPVRFTVFLSDTQEIGRAVQVGFGDWTAQLEANKSAYFTNLVATQRFIAEFPVSMTAVQFVDRLNANTGDVLTQAERDGLVSDLTSGAKSRAQVMRAVAENTKLKENEFNKAFVLMQYFGYLRRDPDSGNDVDFSGWQFWLNKLNQFRGDFQRAEMVKAFLLSTEYRQRFGL